jgi:hypothetical protein
VPPEGDLLRSGAQWLDQMRTRHCAAIVEYRRGETSIEIAATLGRSTYDVEDEYGIRVGMAVTDFLISSDVFPLDEPRIGDRIVADGVIYEVMPLGGEGHYRWSDPYRRTLRIHTKEVGRP